MLRRFWLFCLRSCTDSSSFLCGGAQARKKMFKLKALFYPFHKQTLTTGWCYAFKPGSSLHLRPHLGGWKGIIHSGLSSC